MYRILLILAEMQKKLQKTAISFFPNKIFSCGCVRFYTHEATTCRKEQFKINKTPAKHCDIFREKCNESARVRTHDLVSPRQTH